MRLSKRGRRRLLVLLIASVALGAGGFAFKSIRSVQQQRLIAQARAVGLERYRAGDLASALHELQYVFQHVKDDLEVNLAFADARARQPAPGGSHLGEAIDLYTTRGLKLLEEQDRSPQVTAQRQDILNKLLDLYAQAGFRNELLQTADRLLVLDPDSIDALAAKAEVHFVEREFEPAIALADRLIALDPSNLRWRRLHLETQQRQGLTNEAIVRQCREWASAYRGDGRFHLLTAVVLFDMNEIEQAKAEMEAAVDLGASTQDVLEQSVAMLDLLEMRTEAGELIAVTMQKFPAEQWVHEVAVQRLWYANEIANARAELERAEGMLPELGPGLRRLKVMTLISAEQPEQAREALKPLEEKSADRRRDADRAWAAAVAAYLNDDRGQWRENIQTIQEAIIISPQDAVLHFLLGEAWEQGGEQARAVAAFEQAFTLAPAWMAAGIAYVDALHRVGRIEESYDNSRILLSRSAKDRLAPFLLYARAWLALREARSGAGGRDAEAAAQIVRVLEQAAQDASHPAQVAALLVEAYVKTGQPEKAAAFIAQEIARPNPQPDLLLALVEISRRFQLEQEQALLAAARRAAPESFPVAFAMAEEMAEDGDAAGGLKLIDEALAAASLTPEQRRIALCARIGFMLAMGHEHAQYELRQAVEAHPDSVEVQHFVLAQPAAWGDERLVSRAVTNLKSILGEQSQQVRLAEANLVLQHHAGNQALLAKSIMQINSVLQQSPDSLAALSLMADASLAGDHPNLDRAIESLEHAVGVYPAEPSLVIRLIALLHRKGDYEKAGSYLSGLASLAAWKPEVRPEELRLLQAQGDFETALVRATAIVNETSPPPHQLILASMHHRAGQQQQAEQIYQRLLEAPDASPMVRAQGAEFYAQTGRFERGLDLIQTIDPAAMSTTHELLLGSFHQRHGRLDEAGNWLRQAVQKSPQSVEAHHELARHYLSINERVKARDEALAGLQIDPKHTGLRGTLAVANLGMPGADRQEAIKLLRELGAENDDLLATLELLEKIPVRAGRVEPTDANLVDAKRLTERHGGFAPCWLLAISLHVEADRRPEAIDLARTAVSRLPSNPEPAQWATQLLIEAERWQQALAEALEWRRRSLHNPRAADMAIAGIYLSLARPADAVEQLQPHLNEIVEQRSRFPDRFVLLLRALAHAGRLEQAQQLAGGLLPGDATLRKVWLTIASEIDDASAYDALMQLESVTVEPQECLALAAEWTNLGRHSSRGECFEHAEGLALKAAEDDRLAAQALIVRGAIAEARGDAGAAETLYRQALQREDANPVALNNLAFVLSKSPERCPEALPLIERALHVQPNQPDLLDTHAQVLIGLNRLEEARASLESALAQRPADVAIALNLVELLLRLNKIDEAAKRLEEAQRSLLGASRPNSALQGRIDDLRLQIREQQRVPRASSSAEDQDRTRTGGTH